MSVPPGERVSLGASPRPSPAPAWDWMNWMLWPPALSAPPVPHGKFRETRTNGSERLKEQRRKKNLSSKITAHKQNSGCKAKHSVHLSKHDLWEPFWEGTSFALRGNQLFRPRPFFCRGQHTDTKKISSCLYGPISGQQHYCRPHAMSIIGMMPQASYLMMPDNDKYNATKYSVGICHHSRIKPLTTWKPIS